MKTVSYIVGVNLDGYVYETHYLEEKPVGVSKEQREYQKRH